MTATETNRLYFYANKYSQNITDEAELEKIDMTEDFWKEINAEVREGELVIITINGKVRLGKSTGAFAVGKKIFEEILTAHGQQPKGVKFGMKNIDRDQQEHSKSMRNPKTSFTLKVVDEENELEDTGENVTVEKALRNVFSNVQAGRYVHKISCCPKGVSDPNSDIILEIVGTNKEEMTTHAKLYYRLYKGGEERMQLLGYVTIDARPIIENWINNVRKHYYKPEEMKTEEDKKIVKENMKKDWYIEYIVKKHEKMDILTKEGIFKPRTLDYAEVIIKIVEELQGLTTHGNILTNNIIRNFVKARMREEKIPMSIIGEKLITDEVSGVLELHKGLTKISKKIRELKQNQKNPLKALLPKELKMTEQSLREMAGVINKAIEEQMKELMKYREINQKYNRILK